MSKASPEHFSPRAHKSETNRAVDASELPRITNENERGGDSKDYVIRGPKSFDEETDSTPQVTQSGEKRAFRVKESDIIGSEKKAKNDEIKNWQELKMDGYPDTKAEPPQGVNIEISDEERLADLHEYFAGDLGEELVTPDKPMFETGTPGTEETSISEVAPQQEIKNWQELKMDGYAEKKREVVPPAETFSFDPQQAFEVLTQSEGWNRSEVDAARNVLLEEGFVKGMLTPEKITYIKSLEGKTLDAIEDWPPELLTVLQDVGFTLGKWDQFTQAYEVSTERMGITLTAKFTPRRAVGFLKSMLGLPEHGRYPFEVEDAMDDFTLPTDSQNQNFKPENITKATRAGEVLRRHEIIRDPKKEFDDRFHTELGIHERDLRQFEGFEKLSLAQQKLIFEQVKEYKETNPQSIAGKIWEKIRSPFSDDEKTSRMSGKSMEMYGATIAALVKNMAERGPKVHKTPDGKLLPDLIGLEYHRDHRKEQREASNALNRAAYALAQTPDSWRKIIFDQEAANEHDGIFAKLKSSAARIFSADAEKKNALFIAREKAYDDAKNAFTEALRKSGMGESGIIRALIELDGKVATLQFAQTAPEALEMVRTGVDPRTTEEITRSFSTKEALAYMGIGAVSKMALRQTFDWATGPAVASALGGIKSWRKSGKELIKRDQKARFGEVDTSKEALNMASVSENFDIKLKNSKNEIVSTRSIDRSAVAKTRSIIDRIQALHGETGAEALASRTKLLEQLKVRVEYVEEKRRLNRINFGKPHEVPNNIAKLYETLAEAHVLLADRVDPAISLSEMRFESIKSLVNERGATYEKVVESVKKAQVEDANIREIAQKKDARRTTYFTKREQNIQKKRLWFKTKEASKGTLKAGAFSLLGAGLFELFESDRRVTELDEIKESIQRAFESRSGIPVVENLNGTLSVAEAGFDDTSDVRGSIQTLEDLGPIHDVPQIPETYTIKSGDTLTNILKEHIPEIKALGPGQAQETAIANALKALTAETLKEAGLGPNKDLIFEGKTLKLRTLAEQIAKAGVLKK